MDSPALPVAVRQLSDLPRPRGLPLLGNLLQVKPERFHLILEEWAAKLGTPFAFRMANRLLVVWSDVEQVQTVLRERPHRFRRLGLMEPVFEELGANGLFSAEGAAWHAQRRLVAPALAAPNFRGFFAPLYAITQRLLKRWQASAVGGHSVDMAQDLMRYTVDVTCALAFGEDPNTLEQQGDVIQNHLASIMPGLMRRIHAPWPWWRYVRLPADRRLDRDMAVVHQYARDMMERSRRRMRDEPSQNPRNLLESMLATRDAPQSGVSDDDVAANVLTLLLAGEDTTANSLAWTMYYLAADPALQERLHEQARQVLGEQLLCPSLEAMRQLDGFEALATEATRLRPVAPYTAHEPLQDVRLGDVEVPAGTCVLLLHRPAMVDARHFAAPHIYDPERWTRTRTERSGAHEARGYTAFGAGPRVCPGRHLAGVEMRLVLSMLLRNFSLRLTIDPASIREVLSFTMMPSAMPVQLTAR